VTLSLLATTFALAGSTLSGQTVASDVPFRPAPRRRDALKVLLVTGGDDHDVSFYSVLDGHDDLDVLVDPHPNAFRESMTRRANLQAFVENGGGIVALHHALAGYTGWRWWSEEVVGGRYRHEPEDGHPASSYLHDVDLLVRPRRAHPITQDLGSFRIHDETYKGLWISPRAEVLLETDHPTSDGPVAWTFPHPKARVVCIQLGHGREAHLNPAYRRLVRNAVLWAGRRLGP